MVVRVDDPRRRNPEVVRAVLMGASEVFPVPAALSAMRDLDLPVAEQEDLVGRVLESADDPVARAVAASSLRRLATDGARQRLRAALGVEREERVAGDLALALGYVGDESDIPVLVAKEREVTGVFATNRARFAAGLLAHRLGLDEPDLRFPPPEARLTIRERKRPIHGRKAREDEVSKALDGVRNDKVGFTTDREFVHALDCGPRTVYLALNKDVASAFGQLTTRKALLGTVATYSEEHDRTTPAYLLLTSPTEGGFDLLVTRTTGEELYRGTGRAEGQRVEVDVWSIDTIGVPAIDLRLKLEGTDLSGHGESEDVIRKQRQPQRIR